MRKNGKILVFFSDRPFFRDHTILEIFCFEHSGRFFPTLKLFCSPIRLCNSKTDFIAKRLFRRSQQVFFRWHYRFTYVSLRLPNSTLKNLFSSYSP